MVVAIRLEGLIYGSLQELQLSCRLVVAGIGSSKFLDQARTHEVMAMSCDSSGDGSASLLAADISDGLTDRRDYPSAWLMFVFLAEATTLVSKVVAISSTLE